MNKQSKICMSSSIHFNDTVNGEYQYLLNHINDLGHVLRDLWFHRGRQTIKSYHVSTEFFTIAPAQTDWIFS